MCSYITERAPLVGSAKGSNGWMSVDVAHVAYDHPFHAPLDHALTIDFVSEARSGQERIALEISADSARELVARILRALERGEAEHGASTASGGTEKS